MDDVDEIVACRDQLARMGELLTARGATSGERKRLVRAFREGAMALADAAVAVCKRNVALAQENKVLRARLGEQDASADQTGPMI